MLQNLRRIQKQKQHHLKKIQRLNLKKKSDKLQTALQQKTVTLINKQLQTINLLKLISVFRLICKKVYQPAYLQIFKHTTYKKRADQKLSKDSVIRVKILGFKIDKFLRKKNQQLRKQFILLLYSSLRNRDNIKCNDNADKCINPKQQVNALSFLDISQISPQQNQHITDVPFQLDQSTQNNNYLQVYHNQKPHARQNIEQLKLRISKKKQQIEQYKQNKQQQIKSLKIQLQNIEKSRIQQFSKITQAEYEEEQSSQPQQQQINDDQIVATMIRKNFELQQKLESVYQIMSCVAPDMNTVFGQLLSKIIRKKSRNIELES